MTSVATKDRLFMVMLFSVHLPIIAFVFVIGMTFQPQTYNWFTVGLRGVNWGIGVGQIFLLCGWTAFGTGSFLRRMLISMLLIALTLHAAWLVAGVWLGNEHVDYGTMGSSCVGLILLFTLIQVPYWTLRRFKQWRIEHSTQLWVGNEDSRTKFGVLDVFAWTAYVAVPLALVGGMMGNTPFSDVLPTIMMYLIMMIPALQSLILIWASIGPGRKRRRRFVVVVFLLALAFATSLLAFQQLMMGRINGWGAIVNFFRWNWTQALMHMGMAIGILLPMGLTMLLVSCGGYELRTHATQRP